MIVASDSTSRPRRKVEVDRKLARRRATRPDLRAARRYAAGPSARTRALRLQGRRLATRHPGKGRRSPGTSSRRATFVPMPHWTGRRICVRRFSQGRDNRSSGQASSCWANCARLRTSPSPRVVLATTFRPGLRAAHISSAGGSIRTSRLSGISCRMPQRARPRPDQALPRASSAAGQAEPRSCARPRPTMRRSRATRLRTTTSSSTTIRARMSCATSTATRGDGFPAAKADMLGAVCPHFAHIRKMNPRDSATDLGKPLDTLLRLIFRRGIPFGPPVVGAKRPRPDCWRRSAG